MQKSVRLGGNLISVQWLRAVAALMVVVHHSLYYSNVISGQPDSPRVLFGFGSWSFGIHIFFVLSGFIMVATVGSFGERGAWKGFVVRRFVRIVPLYWLLTTAMASTLLLASGMQTVAFDKGLYIASSYLFIPALRAAGDLRPVLGQGWTLNYEMFFYFVFAVLLAFPRRKAVVALAVVFSALAWLGRNLTIETPTLFTWTDGLLLEFVFGAVVGLAFAEGFKMPRWLSFASILGGAALAYCEFTGPTALIVGVPAAMIVAGSVLGPQPKLAGRAGRMLAFIGDASYSLYLTHVFVLHPLERFWASRVGENLPHSVFIILAMFGSVAVGGIIYRFIEKPMTVFLQRRLLRPVVSPNPREAIATPR